MISRMLRKVLPLAWLLACVVWAAPEMAGAREWTQFEMNNQEDHK